MNILTVDDIKNESTKYSEIDVLAKDKYADFAKRFHYSVLEKLDDGEILDYIVYGTVKSSLCYTLENDPYYAEFGSVRMPGNMAVYRLFKRKDGVWCAGYGVKGIKTGPLLDQVNKPLEIAKIIRDNLVKGGKIIEEWKNFDTEDDYKSLYDKLFVATEGLIQYMWMRKYYHMLFPDRFSTFYGDKFVDNVLNDFGLSRKGDSYTKLGRLALFVKQCGTSSRVLGEIYHVLVYSVGLSGTLVRAETTHSTKSERKTMEKEYPLNRIFFGAPGTGKSYLLNLQQKDNFDAENVERVTFHPDYSYANFVGAYKPVTKTKTVATTDDPDVCAVVEVLTDKNRSGQEKYDALFERFKMGDGLTRLPLLLSLYSVDDFRTKKWDGSYTANNNDVEINHGKVLQKYVRPYSRADEETSSEIEYRYVPGPFMRVYTEAVRHPDKNYLLIIEEINRANVAAVFGDVFQLLDRTEEGISEYPIQASEDIRNYLARELGGAPNKYKKISIPANMYIWATMNSADQGVFPMDTAFKRRWDFEYIGIDDSEGGIVGKYVQLANGSQKVEWNKLRKAINDYLAENKINEDKQLGPYFIAKDIVAPKGSDIDAERFISTFKNKVIMYLYEDAARQKRDDLFDGCDGKRYSEICREFDEKGYEIFNQSIVDKLS